MNTQRNKKAPQESDDNQCAGSPGQSGAKNPFDDDNNLIVDDIEEPKHRDDPLRGDAEEDVMIAGQQSRQFGA